MPMARVTFRLLTSSQANATTVKGLIDTRIATRSHVDDVVSRIKQIGANWCVLGSFRFLSRLDGEDLRDYVQTRWSGASAGIILAGSRIDFHMCPQDDARESLGDCAGFEYARVVK